MNAENLFLWEFLTKLVICIGILVCIIVILFLCAAVAALLYGVWKGIRE